MLFYIFFVLALLVAVPWNHSTKGTVTSVCSSTVNVGVLFKRLTSLTAMENQAAVSELDTENVRTKATVNVLEART